MFFELCDSKSGMIKSISIDLTKLDKHVHCLNNVVLEVTESFETRPDVHISKSFYTNNTGFWNFVFDAIIEAKQVSIDQIVEFESAIKEGGESKIERSEHGISGCNRAKERLNKFREIETALAKSGLVTGRDRMKFKTAGDLLTPA